MIRISLLALALVAACLAPLQGAEPLRVFIRAGAKTHGPNQHDHPRFLKEAGDLLNQRGARATGALEFPTPQQLAETDVLVMYCPDGGIMASEQKTSLDEFTKRGGGIVVIHDAVCGNKADWFKTVIGGAWQHGKAKWFEGEMSLYYVDHEHPITAGASNFDLDDEMYYDLDLLPEARVLAATWTPDERAKKNGRASPHIYNVAPQMWTYEKDNYRAFVTIPGHNWKTFELPQYRAILLRGIAWAGKRADVDELCEPDELGALRYPPGGPTHPAESGAKLTGHPDFKTTLAAAEPLINKPMNIDWDPTGRMWVAETPEYPNGRRGIKRDYPEPAWKDHGGLVAERGRQERPATDRISILTDSNADGTLDRKEVFADGLELVTGFVFHKDGVIATQAPDILWIRDTDGDGKSDKTEKLYTGLGTGDTHAVINNPRWGFDGWIYATHGYSGGDVSSGDGSKKFGRIGSGVVRFKPDGSAIEQYSSKGGNTWGLQITWDNEVLWTQPTSGDLLMHTVLPEYQLARGKVGDTASYKVVSKSGKSFPVMTWNQQAYRQIDFVGSFTAAAGCAIYDGGTWPAAWNGAYFTTEPTINVVHQQFLDERGVSFSGRKEAGREEVEFIGSKDLWYRPIEVRIGPDGALYVVDFYNQAVIHNDTRGPIHNGVNAAVRPDRDHYFGRIWRVDHKNAKAISAPNLTNAAPADLVRALSHGNNAVRMSAARLLTERGEGTAELAAAVPDASKPATLRIHALWILQKQGKLAEPALAAAIADKDPAVSRNALKVAAERSNAPAGGDPAVLARLSDANLRLRLAAVLALGAGPSTEQSREALLKAFPLTDDSHVQSAIAGVASREPALFLTSAFAARDVTPLRPLAVQLADRIKSDAQASAGLLISLKAGLPQIATVSGGEAALSAVIERIADGAKGSNIPAWTAELQDALAAYVKSPMAGAVLPLVVAWDRENRMTPEMRALATDLLAKIRPEAKGDDEARAQLAATLIGIRSLDPAILNEVGALLGSPAAEAVQRRIIAELGNTSDLASGKLMVGAYSKLAPPLQAAAFAHLLKRAEWTRALVEAIQAGSVPLVGFGPVALDKLRNHPDVPVAKLASKAIDSIRGPMLQQKDQAIAKMLAVVETGGNVALGKQLYMSSCAVCHRFNGEGANLAPELTGMGAHPRAELLTHIVDPNREVDPSFAAYNFETKAGETYQGIVVRENSGTVLVRDAAGEHELKKNDLKSRQEVGRSLMPEGFEALGAEPLRDIIAFLQSGDSKFRIIDLKTAYTADSRLGLFNSESAMGETLKFARSGDVRVGEIPFKVADPAAGKNLVILKGGDGMAKTAYPQRVEIPAGKVKAGALHFLGGVGGWAWPCCGDAEREGAPAAKVTVVYEGGETAELLLKNGVEFADYISASANVPGSELAKDLVTDGRQVRVFRKALPKEGVLEKIVLESYDNFMAPVFVAITAEAGAPAADRHAARTEKEPAAQAASPPSPEKVAANGTAGGAASLSEKRALAVGGGSSHDFNRWFGEADKALLTSLKPAAYEYTDRPDKLANTEAVDVLYLSTNQPLPSEARKGIFDMVNAGKGLLLVHPALWYNWTNFPEYNRDLVGGGSRSHDKFGQFEVRVVDRNHPITAGLPERFAITDELYHFEADPKGAAIQVLAEATSPVTGKTFPVVWTTKHAKARIACITLGHDGKAHDLPEFQMLLKNAFRWTAE